MRLFTWNKFHNILHFLILFTTKTADWQCGTRNVLERVVTFIDFGNRVSRGTCYIKEATRFIN
jgi:hypothetical protein